MSDFGSCEFCGRPGAKLAGVEDGLESDFFACTGCRKLLSKPVTALPLIRGHLTLELRGKMSKKRLDNMMQVGMEILSKMKKKDPSN